MLSLKTQGKTNTSGYFQNYFNDLFAKKRKLVKLEIDQLDRVRANWQTILGSTVTDRAKAEIGLNIPHMQPAIDLAKSCGWCWTFENLTILTPKPSQVKVDRLGNITSVIYRDVNILNNLHQSI